MVAYARRKLLGRDRKAVYHCWVRCVRRAFLCGLDPLTGRDFSHRRDWILTREEQLAALFAIEVEFHAELSNHLHLMLRSRPDVAKRWSPHEVARRYLTIMRIAKCMSDDLPLPNEKRIEQAVRNKKRIQQMRRRLSNISWFMGILCENIARRANQEDECTGRFFETRFKCRECADPHGMLICALYVDLNPIKAGEAASPRTARYTSAYQRILAQEQRPNSPNRADGWLGELTLREETLQDETIAFSSRWGRRASDLGLLEISLENYLRLLQWTARQLRSGQRTAVPKDVETLLDYLEVNEEAWLDTLQRYDSVFCHAVGTPAALEKVAQRMGRSCLKGASASRRLFA